MPSKPGEAMVGGTGRQQQQQQQHYHAHQHHQTLPPAATASLKEDELPATATVSSTAGAVGALPTATTTIATQAATTTTSSSPATHALALQIAAALSTSPAGVARMSTSSSLSSSASTSSSSSSAGPGISVAAAATSSTLAAATAADVANEQRQQQYDLNAKLCRLVRKCLWLYDRSHPHYGKKCVLDKTWMGIARQCKDSVASCKERWRNIRAAFARSINIYKTNGGPNRVKPYYLHAELEFLIRPMKEARDKTVLRSPFVGGMETREVLQIIKEGEEVEADVDADADEDELGDVDDVEEYQDEEGRRFTFNDVDGEASNASSDVALVGVGGGGSITVSEDPKDPTADHIKGEEKEGCCAAGDDAPPPSSLPGMDNDAADVEAEFNAEDVSLLPLAGRQQTKQQRVVQPQLYHGQMPAKMFVPPMAYLGGSCGDGDVKRLQPPAADSLCSGSPDADVKFLEALLPDLRSMGPRQKIAFKRRIYESLEEVMDMVAPCAGSNPPPPMSQKRSREVEEEEEVAAQRSQQQHQHSTPRSAPREQSPPASSAPVDWQRLCAVMLRHIPLEQAEHPDAAATIIPRSKVARLRNRGAESPAPNNHADSVCNGGTTTKLAAVVPIVVPIVVKEETLDDADVDID